MTFDGRSALSLIMFLLFAGASLMALGLPGKAAFMPLLIGVPGALMCAWQLFSDLRRGPGPAEPEKESGEGQSETEAFVWLGVFFATLIGFGFIVGAPLAVFAYVRFSSRESWRNALFAGAGTYVVMYGVFTRLLELPLFQGLVLQWLFG